jgi:hypothetical protein
MNLSCSGSGGRKRLALDTSLHTGSPKNVNTPSLGQHTLFEKKKHKFK